MIAVKYKSGNKRGKRCAIRDMLKLTYLKRQLETYQGIPIQSHQGGMYQCHLTSPSCRSLSSRRNDTGPCAVLLSARLFPGLLLVLPGLAANPSTSVEGRLPLPLSPLPWGSGTPPPDSLGGCSDVIQMFPLDVPGACCLSPPL